MRTTEDGRPLLLEGTTRPFVDEVPPVPPNLELREDGTYELREDGSFELRE